VKTYFLFTILKARKQDYYPLKAVQRELIFIYIIRERELLSYKEA